VVVFISAATPGHYHGPLSCWCTVAIIQD